MQRWRVRSTRKGGRRSGHAQMANGLLFFSIAFFAKERGVDTKAAVWLDKMGSAAGKRTQARLIHKPISNAKTQPAALSSFVAQDWKKGVEITEEKLKEAWERVAQERWGFLETGWQEKQKIATRHQKQRTVPERNFWVAGRSKKLVKILLANRKANCESAAGPR